MVTKTNKRIADVLSKTKTCEEDCQLIITIRKGNIKQIAKRNILYEVEKI